MHRFRKTWEISYLSHNFSLVYKQYATAKHTGIALRIFTVPGKTINNRILHCVPKKVPPPLNMSKFLQKYRTLFSYPLTKSIISNLDKMTNFPDNLSYYNWYISNYKLVGTRKLQFPILFTYWRQHWCTFHFIKTAWLSVAYSTVRVCERWWSTF